MRARGQLEQALAGFHHALGLAPGDPTTQLEIAELYLELNQPHRAMAALDGVLEAYTPGEEPQRVLFQRGLAYAALGRYNDAVESYSAACIREQPSAEILYRLAEAETLACRPGRAIKAAQEALALDPQHRPSHQLLSKLGFARKSDGV